MKKDLESWLRGEMPQSAGTQTANAQTVNTQGADTRSSAADLRLPVVALMTEPREPQQAEDTVPDVPNDVSDDIPGESAIHETESMPVVEPAEEAEPAGGDSAGEEIFVPVTDFPQDGVDAEEPAVPEIEPEEQDSDGELDAKDDCSENEQPPVLESPEQSSSRMEMRLKQMKDLQRAAYMYEQGDEILRFRRRRVVALCVLAFVVIGAALLLYRALRSDPYEVTMDRARGLYERKEYAASLEAYNQASLEYEDKAEPFLGAARSAGGMGRVDDAIAAYRACLERFPVDDARWRSGVFYEIGCLQATLKAWPDAQSSFEEAIETDDSNYGAHFSLGNVLEERGQPDKALLAYRQALLVSPSSDAAAEAVQRVSFALDSRGEKEEKEAAAEQKYGQALSSGDAALKDERYAEASKYFAEALAVRSDDADAWVGFAEARGKLGDTGGAVKSLERALERDPEHGAARSKLAEMEAQRKKNAAPRRRNTASSRQSSNSQSPAKNDATQPRAVLSKKALFDAGVELYRGEEYAKAFDSFIACLRSAERDLLPHVSLAGDAGPIWKGNQVKLNLPLNARLLVESVRLNPADRDLYVNLSMAAAKMDLNRQAAHSAMNEARSHALMMASIVN